MTDASILLLVCAVPIYFLPSLMAGGRKGAGGVFALNLFFGWTGLGWLAAIIWAMATPKAPKETFYVQKPDGTFRRVER